MGDACARATTHHDPIRGIGKRSDEQHGGASANNVWPSEPDAGRDDRDSEGPATDNGALQTSIRQLVQRYGQRLVTTAHERLHPECQRQQPPRDTDDELGKETKDPEYSIQSAQPEGKDLVLEQQHR